MNNKYTILFLMLLVSISALCGEPVLPNNPNAKWKLPPLNDGAWPCKYYWLNYNEDIEVAEKAQWYSLDEDDSDWVDGVGPFSNSNDKFLTTEWGSSVRPILIRRHFTLTAYEREAILSGSATIFCSYDENPKIYLNGILIKEYDGFNDNSYEKHLFTKNERTYFREGDNVMAVSLMQGEGGGHIDFALYIIIPPDPNPVKQISMDIDDDTIFYSIDGKYMGDDMNMLARGMYVTNNGTKIIKK